MNLARQWHDKTPRPISEEVSLLNTVLNARNQQQLMQQAMNSVGTARIQVALLSCGTTRP